MRKEKPTESLSLEEATYCVIHEFGIKRLAGLLDLPPTTLYTKADPHQASGLTACELVRITLLARDDRLIEAVSREVGGAFYRLPERTDDTDADLLQLMCRLGAEEGEFCQALLFHFADRKISQDEFRRLDKELFDIVAAVATIRARLQAIANG